MVFSNTDKRRRCIPVPRLQLNNISLPISHWTPLATAFFCMLTQMKKVCIILEALRYVCKHMQNALIFVSVLSFRNFKTVHSGVVTRMSGKCENTALYSVHVM